MMLDSVNTKDSRIVYYDALSGIMLMMMMHHHFCGMSGLYEFPIHMIPYKILYFYMAYFFYKAGIFYNSQRSWKKEFIISIRRLIVPFVIFSIIGYVLFGAEDSITCWRYWWYPLYQLCAIGRIPGNGPLWFLLTLFLVRIIFQSAGDKRWMQIVWIIIGAIVAIIGNYYEIRPRTISNVALGLFFYGCGYVLREKQYNKNMRLIAPILFGIIYLGMMIWGWNIVDVSLNITVLGLHPLWLFSCVVACAAVNVITKWFSSICELKPLAWIGKNSMPFLCIHALLYQTTHLYIYPHFAISPYTMLAVDWVGIFFICSLAVWCFRNKYLSWMVGEKY